jgi:hypothetical protein
MSPLASSSNRNVGDVLALHHDLKLPRTLDLDRMSSWR